MPVLDLNHVNIVAQSDEFDSVREFYVNILGLSEGWSPDIGRRVSWLYAGDKPVIHLVENTNMGRVGESMCSEPIDHVAFSCTGIEAIQQTLKTAAIKYIRTDTTGGRFSQLKFRDPLGVTLELNFADVGTN